MIPPAPDEIARIHGLVWYEQQRALEEYARNLWRELEERRDEVKLLHNELGWKCVRDAYLKD